MTARTDSAVIKDLQHEGFVPYLLVHGAKTNGQSWSIETDDADWSTNEAMRIVRDNEQFVLLQKMGWEMEDGAWRGTCENGYFCMINSVRSPKGLFSGNRRVTRVQYAFRKARDMGFPGLDIPKEAQFSAVAFDAGRFVRVCVWCKYCDQWHSHGAGDQQPALRVGYNDHRIAHCASAHWKQRLGGYTFTVKAVF